LNSPAPPPQYVREALIDSSKAYRSCLSRAFLNLCQLKSMGDHCQPSLRSVSRSRQLRVLRAERAFDSIWRALEGYTRILILSLLLVLASHQEGFFLPCLFVRSARARYRCPRLQLLISGFFARFSEFDSGLGCFCPHLGQNRAEAGILFLHFEQILNTSVRRSRAPQRLQ